MADPAIARAKELDEYFKKTGKIVGPLVSIPPQDACGCDASVKYGTTARRSNVRQRACWSQGIYTERELRYPVSVFFPFGARKAAILSDSYKGR